MTQELYSTDWENAFAGIDISFCFMINLWNWLINMFLVDHFLMHFLILHSSPKQFCVPLKRWTKYKMTRQIITDYQQYSVQRNLITTLVRNARAKCENDIASKLQTNSKQFWAYINQIAKVKPICWRQMMGTTTKNESEIATILNYYFCTVFWENSEPLPPFDPRPYSSVFESLMFCLTLLMV